MQTGNVTTPFGRRSMTLALVKGQLETAAMPSGKSADKWKIFRDACDARTLLGLKDRALAVLNALLTFHPDTRLEADGNLIVFPSNMQLSARANGIAGTTLRENLAHLVKAGLIHRKDSPNGKRYARKGADGGINDAYGFSLAPLLARAEELAQLAQQVAAERLRVRILKEKITILRRDLRKLISAAMEEGADGEWMTVEAHYIAAVGALARAKTTRNLESVLDTFALLHAEVVNLLESQVISPKYDTNDDEIRQHIQNSNTQSTHELEPCFEMQEEARAGDQPSALRGAERQQPKAFPLGMVLRACPDIHDYGPEGRISNWRDLMTAAVVVRSTLGISPSAYQQACEAMGAENAATAVACILERVGHIQSPGGYLRDLSRRAERGEFSLGPMLMALLRTNAPAERKIC